MFALVDGKRFRNTLLVSFVGVFPTRLKFLHGNQVWRVAIHLVGRHVHKRDGRRISPRGFQKIECAYSICIKVLKRYGGGTIMTWLGSSVYYRIRCNILYGLEYSSRSRISNSMWMKFLS